MRLFTLLAFASLCFSSAPCAQVLDWSSALQPPAGPLQVEVTSLRALSDGSTLVGGISGGSSSTVSPRVSVLMRVGPTGEHLWQLDLGETLGTTSSFPVDALQTSGGELLVAADSSVARIDPGTGALIWLRQLPGWESRLAEGPAGSVYVLGSAGENTGGIFSSTVMQVQQIAVADGDVAWRSTYPAPPPTPFDERVSAFEVFADGDLLVASTGRRLLRLDAPTGAVEWSVVRAVGANSPPKLRVDAEGQILEFHGGADGGLVRRSGSSGSVLWQLPAQGGLANQIPFGLFVTADGRVLSVSHPTTTSISGPVEVTLRSSSLVDGSLNWQFNLATGSDGPRFLREVVQAAPKNRLALLLSPSTQTSTLASPSPPGRRLLLIDSSTGQALLDRDLSAATPPGHSDRLVSSGSGDLRAAGFAGAPLTPPALYVNAIDGLSGLPGTSTSANDFDSYAELARVALSVDDGSSVVLSKRSGVEDDVLALTRLDPSGAPLWRRDLSDAEYRGLDWVALSQRASNELVALARPTQGSNPPQLLAFRLDTGQTLWQSPLVSEFCSVFVPQALEVHADSSAIFVAGNQLAPCADALVIKLSGSLGDEVWQAPLTWIDSFRQMAVDGEGNPILLGTGAGEGGSRREALVSLGSASGFARWVRTFNPGSVTWNALLIDNAEAELRVAGAGSLSGPTLLWEERFALDSGQTLESDSHACASGGVNPASVQLFRAGAKVVTLAQCDAGLQRFLRVRPSWSAAASTALLQGEATSAPLAAVAPISADALAMLLFDGSVSSSGLDFQPSRIARLDLRTGTLSWRTPLVLPGGEPIDASRLLSANGELTAIGRYDYQGRPRAAVARVVDVGLFADGFESATASP
jgi:outer membrane protein assembly factor BamB